MENDIIKFNLPLRVRISKTKDFILNLNVFRNTHYRVLSMAKRRYSDIVIATAPYIDYKIERCELKVTLYPKTRRRADLSNACSIVDKFAMDSLQDKGYFNDDDYHTIPKVTYEFGEVDKENPRFEIEIKVLQRSLL